MLRMIARHHPTTRQGRIIFASTNLTLQLPTRHRPKSGVPRRRSRNVQITETWNPQTAFGRFLTHNKGPGLFHVAWAVDNLPAVARRLALNGHDMGKNDGITHSPRSYAACNVDVKRSHGILFQLAEGKRQVETKA